MMKKQGIVVKSIQISEKKFNLSKLEFKLSEDQEKKLLTLLPPLEKSISFELHNTNAKFANAFRRCIKDEIPIYNLNCDIHNVKSNDRKLITTSDSIVRRLKLIPITQELAKSAVTSNLKFGINVENNESKILSVTSKDIIISQHNHVKSSFQKVSNTKYFSDKITICELDRGRYLNISDIDIQQNKNYELSVGGLISSFKYIPIKYEKNLMATSKSNPPTSLMTHPSEYRLGFSMNNILTSPIYIIKLTCQELTTRLVTIKKGIEDSDKEIPYYSDVLEITKPKKVTQYKIIGESWTIGNLLFRYGYDVDPSIPLIKSRNEHALTHSIIIDIIHPDSQKLLITAIDNIIADINVVFEAFEKYKV